MARDFLRQPKIYSAPKEQKKFVFPKFVKVLIWLSLLIIGLIYLIYFSSVFKIKSIQIVGEPKKESEQYLENYKNKNIFSLKTNQIKEKLATDNPEYLNVKILKGIPSTLRVIFETRIAKIIWVSSTNSYLVDANGIVFKKDDTETNLVKVLDKKRIVVEIPSQITTQNFISFVISAQDQVSNYNDFKVDHFEIDETTFQVDAITDKKIKIIFDTTRTLSDQIDAFKKAFEEKKSEITEYIDVRVEGVVYYK